MRRIVTLVAVLGLAACGTETTAPVAEAPAVIVTAVRRDDGFLPSRFTAEIQNTGASGWYRTSVYRFVSNDSVAPTCESLWSPPTRIDAAQFTVFVLRTCTGRVDWIVTESSADSLRWRRTGCRGSSACPVALEPER